MYTRRQWVNQISSTGAAWAAMSLMPVRAQQTPIELTFSIWIPANHVLVANFMMPWAKEVEEATSGRVKIRFLPKPVTNPVGHYDAVRNGVVDMAFISHSYYPGRFDLMKFSMLPFSGNTALSSSVAGWRIYDKYLRGANEHRGVKLLGTYNHGPGAVFTTGHQVTRIEDFKGLRLRIGGGMQADVAKVLEVNAIVKPAPESYELMSTGVVDGVFFPPESVASFRLESIIKETTVFPGGLYSDVHGIIMNEKAWQRISEPDRAVVTKLSGEHIARMGGNAWGGADGTAMQDLKNRGVHIEEAGPQLVADIKRRTAPLTEEWLAVAQKDGIDGPKVLQAFHEELVSMEKAEK